jgi:uncharacterized iron-regulated protein
MFAPCTFRIDVTSRAVILLLLVPLFAFPGTSQGQDPTSATRWSAPPLERSISIRDGRTDQQLDWQTLLNSLAAADVVFLGESHTDETTHRVQLAIHKELIERREHQVVLALEMFDRDVQPQLDAYLAGDIPEEAFLEQSRPWGNYRTAYRPLVEQARREQLPVVAANFPRPLLRRLAFEGPEVLESLADDERHWVPRELLPNSEAYWRRAENAMRGHRGMVRESERLYSTQSLWDNSMGESCAIALERWPEHLVLHVNGDFHSAYWEGAVHQLRQRKPEANVLTVSLVPTPNPSVAEIVGAPSANYVVFVEARAADQSDGTWSVWTPKNAEYRLHIPSEATPDDPAPLLIVLSEEGLTAEETFELWRARLGQSTAIAVLDPPFQERQPDEGVGGRWFWNDSFTSDVGSTVTALERMWAYICRHYPIQPDRVVLLGEGTGGTVAIASTLMTDRMDLMTVAWNPRQFSHLKDLPLPLPEDWGDQQPPRRSVQVTTGSRDQPWWREEIEEFGNVGIEAAHHLLPENPWRTETVLENQLRERLGLENASPAVTDSGDFFLLKSDAPRARHWARMQALWSQQETGKSIAVVDREPDVPGAKQKRLQVSPHELAEPGRLPQSPGPFGGTTVVVLPEEISAAERQAWLDLQEKDPLAQTSRFHRLRLAMSRAEENGVPDLSSVLELLQAENRRNVLVVPATFHADPQWIGQLRRDARQFEDTMTLHWLPGLGGVHSLAAD